MPAPKISKEELIEALTREEIRKSVKKNFEQRIDDAIWDKIEELIKDDDGIQTLIKKEVKTALEKVLPNLAQEYAESASLQAW